MKKQVREVCSYVKSMVIRSNVQINNDNFLILDYLRLFLHFSQYCETESAPVFGVTSHYLLASCQSAAQGTRESRVSAIRAIIGTIPKK